MRIWKVWAGKGNAEARTLLGAMYWSGEGVPRDHKEAARLYLLAANQGSDNVVIFRIDGESGRLSATGQEVAVSQPVCVRFVVKGR